MKTSIFKKTHMTMLNERLIDTMYRLEVKAGETIVTEVKAPAPDLTYVFVIYLGF